MWGQKNCPQIFHFFKHCKYSLIFEGGSYNKPAQCMKKYAKLKYGHKHGNDFYYKEQNNLRRIYANINSRNRQTVTFFA